MEKTKNHKVFLITFIGLSCFLLINECLPIPRNESAVFDEKLAPSTTANGNVLKEEKIVVEIAKELGFDQTLPTLGDTDPKFGLRGLAYNPQAQTWYLVYFHKSRGVHPTTLLKAKDGTTVLIGHFYFMGSPDGKEHLVIKGALTIEDVQKVCQGLTQPLGGLNINTQNWEISKLSVEELETFREDYYWFDRIYGDHLQGLLDTLQSQALQRIIPNITTSSPIPRNTYERIRQQRLDDNLTAMIQMATEKNPHLLGRIQEFHKMILAKQRNIIIRFEDEEVKAKLRQLTKIISATYEAESDIRKEWDKTPSLKLWINVWNQDLVRAMDQDNPFSDNPEEQKRGLENVVRQYLTALKEEQEYLKEDHSQTPLSFDDRWLLTLGPRVEETGQVMAQAAVHALASNLRDEHQVIEGLKQTFEQVDPSVTVDESQLTLIRRWLKNELFLREHPEHQRYATAVWDYLGNLNSTIDPEFPHRDYVLTHWLPEKRQNMVNELRSAGVHDINQMFQILQEMRQPFDHLTLAILKQEIELIQSTLPTQTAPSAQQVANQKGTTSPEAPQQGLKLTVEQLLQLALQQAEKEAPSVRSMEWVRQKLAELQTQMAL